jgi:hypothetical protein
MSFRLIVAAFFAGLCLAITEGLELRANYGAYASCSSS